jgi:hypothetical protein
MKPAAACLVLVACGGKTPPPAPTPEPDPFADDPIAVFETLEQGLLGARQVDVTATIESIGLVSSDLTGELHVEPDRVSWIKVDGGFSGVNTAAKWSSETPIDPIQSDVPPWSWSEALLLGFTRMGALHNWAMVIAGADPEDGNGDVRTWVTVDQLAWKGETPASRTLTFRILVEEQPMGEGELTLGPDHWPVRREQLVHFPEGDMRVVETYATFVVVPGS